MADPILALLSDIHSLVLDNKKRLDILEDIITRTSSLSLSSPRSRSITPVSDDERCSQTLVSGKNKGAKCSKKSTVGPLCTMHHKKLSLFSDLSDEFVPN
jgi:hypothetical protein